MKRKSLYKILAVLVSATFLFAACTKDTADVKLDQTIKTSQLLNVTSNAATVVGYVIAEGEGFNEKGVCYNTSTVPTIDNKKVAYTGQTKTATFNVTLTGLTYATKYFARAYATGATGTVYGEEYSFTTLPVVPILTTAAITAITGNSATAGGNVTGNGGADVTARGVCFGLNPAPTIADGKTTDDKGTGEFVSSISGLKGNTTYYVRAYATNSAGTGYGPEVSFKTLIDLPKVTTAAVTGTTKVSAISGGNVTDEGGGTVTARGIVWGTAANPTITDQKVESGAGAGEFVGNLSGLTSSTVYHVRAFATNSAGTAYGPDVQFTTLADVTKLWVVGSYNGWDNSDKAKYIISTVTSNGEAEGYVFLTSGGFKLVTDHSWSDAATFGDNGSGKLTNPGSDIQVPADGYYLIKANLGTMTYSITLTTWGIIGDATAGGWGDQTNMTYNSTSQTFYLVSHLSSTGSFKFRGTSDWGINYGSELADGKLVKDGPNIPVPVESDYSITLDLSHPTLYTYKAYRWGLIGDAAGSWSDDQNMSWDTANKVFKITVDLVVGSVKFRANDDWAVNYGGDLNALTQDGANIAIGTAGNYTITFSPTTLKATITKN
ncbi:MAG: SusF/SusE family outer membrane protein [Prolixibacteraceae bacterium]